MQISIRGAQVVFGSTTVFTNLSAAFPAGALTVVVGPSGSGKSTLLSALAGYTRLATGSIAIGTRGEHTPSRGLVAWVPQGSNALGARTVLDNVMVGALAAGMTVTEAETRAYEEIRRVGLAHRLFAPARLLSGGELQRVGFARALATSRPMIFADEPSANLDLEATRSLRSMLLALRSTTTIVVATHDPELVAAAEHIVDMREVTRANVA